MDGWKQMNWWVDVTGLSSDGLNEIVACGGVSLFPNWMMLSEESQECWVVFGCLRSLLPRDVFLSWLFASTHPLVHPSIHPPKHLTFSHAIHPPQRNLKGCNLYENWRWRSWMNKRNYIKLNYIIITAGKDECWSWSISIVVFDIL